VKPAVGDEKQLVELACRAAGAQRVPGQPGLVGHACGGGREPGGLRARRADHHAGADVDQGYRPGALNLQDPLQRLRKARH
jgi:hypothetical protein